MRQAHHKEVDLAFQAGITPRFSPKPTCVWPGTLVSVAWTTPSQFLPELRIRFQRILGGSFAMVTTVEFLKDYGLEIRASPA
jgi:hypothetical protein